MWFKNNCNPSSQSAFLLTTGEPSCAYFKRRRYIVHTYYIIFLNFSLLSCNYVLENEGFNSALVCLFVSSDATEESLWVWVL